MNKNCFFRSLKLIIKDDKKILPVMLVSSVIDALYPFVGIVLGAEIISAVADGTQFEKTVLLAVLFVVLNFIGLLIKNAIAQYLDVLYYIEMKKIVQGICEKSWRLDYEVIADAALNNRIVSMSYWIYGQGPLVAVQKMQAVLRNAVSVVTSALILLQFIFAKVKVHEPQYAWLDSVWFWIIFCSIITVKIALSIRNCRIKNKKEALTIKEKEKPLGEYYNMLWAACGDYHRGKDIRLFSAQKLFINRFDTIMSRIRELDEKSLSLTAFMDIAESCAEYLSLYVVYVLIGLKAFFKAFSAGGVIEYTGAVKEFTASVTEIFRAVIDIATNQQYLKMYFEFMDMPENINNGSLIPNVENGVVIEFKNVSFKYRGSCDNVVSNVSFTINNNEKVAFVGTNGSGKTTLVKLLCGLYKPTSGEILLNGIPVQEYDKTEYRKLISVVFQDFSLFAFSIAENVAASQIYDSCEIDEAIAKADMKTYVDGLSKKTDTMLFRYFSEDGIDVSGGEGQKLAIARGHYKKCHFMIADEPTAALDPKSEMVIYENMNASVKDKGTLFISHRLSSCCFCDKIMVFDKGILVESGTHHELLLDKGLYNTMWNAQAKYYN